MSMPAVIRDQIRKLLRSRELFCLGSEMLGRRTPRTLFVTDEVLKAVTYPYPEAHKLLHAEFRQTLDGFLEGGEMTVGEDPRTKDSDALMARVNPIEDEFFDFRITSPRPFIRAFGAFSEHDTFVVVTWEYRDAIGDDFDGEVARCKQEWQKLFGNIKPFAGKTLDEYLSNHLPV